MAFSLETNKRIAMLLKMTISFRKSLRSSDRMTKKESELSPKTKLISLLKNVFKNSESSKEKMRQTTSRRISKQAGTNKMFTVKIKSTSLMLILCSKTFEIKL
tara:strand:- start:79 stop:387 length:309 start_codon:yes stop_codon:yes gene_type:complete